MKFELTIKVSKNAAQKEDDKLCVNNLIDFLKKEIDEVECDSKELNKIYVTMKFKENQFIVEPESWAHEVIDFLQKKFEDLTISYSLLYVDYSEH